MHLKSIPVRLESLLKAIVKERRKKPRPKYLQTVSDAHQTKHTYFHAGIPNLRGIAEKLLHWRCRSRVTHLCRPQKGAFFRLSFFTFTILVRKILIYMCHIVLTTLYTHVVSGIRRRTDQKLRWERGNVNGLLHETMDQQRPQIVSQRGNLAFEMILSEFKRESLLKRFNSFNSSTHLYHP